MRFHKISPCPKCGGKVKAKWEEQHYLSALVFRCGGCRYKPYALALKSKPAVEWEWPKDMMLAAAIRRWNATTEPSDLEHHRLSGAYQL